MVLEAVGQLPEQRQFRGHRPDVWKWLRQFRKGLDSLDRGDSRPIEDVEKLLASWTTK